MVRLKIPISAFKIAKLAQYDICDSLAILCFMFHRRVHPTESLWKRSYGERKILRDLASIPKTISIGNVRITNRRYTIRVHCACQESRNYIHLQTGKTDFMSKDTFHWRNYFPDRDTNLYWIIHHHWIIIMKFKLRYIWSEMTIHIHI